MIVYGMVYSNINRNDMDGKGVVFTRRTHGTANIVFCLFNLFCEDIQSKISLGRWVKWTMNIVTRDYDL